LVALKWSEIPKQPPKWSRGTEQAPVCGDPVCGDQVNGDPISGDPARGDLVARSPHGPRPFPRTRSFSAGIERSYPVDRVRPEPERHPSARRSGGQAGPRETGRSGRPARRTPRRFLWRRTVLVFAIAVSGAVIWDLGSRVVAIAGAEPSLAGSHVYLVRPGDTIWSIAVKSAHGGDPWRTVNKLETEIGGGVLQPGERLELP
jgi:hypothetical protein